MRRRPITFLFSVILAALLYGLIFTLAPQVSLLAIRQDPEILESRFRVALREVVSIPEPEDASSMANTLAARPGSVQDMLKREHELLDTDSARSGNFATLQDVSTRLASDASRDRYDMTAESAMLDRVDARILEISESAARPDLEITRRVVRPSPSTLIPEGVTPTLRSLLDTSERVPLSFNDGGSESRLFAPSPMNPTVDTGGPRYENPDPAPPDPFSMARLGPAEGLLAGMPARKAAEEVKGNSTYEFLDDLLDIRVDTYDPGTNSPGFFRLQILPRAEGKLDVLAKDVTFVIDASSSIPQRKLDLSAKGLQVAIDSLRDIDRFNVVVFRDTPNMFRPAWVVGTAENREAAKTFLNGLESRGETDVYKALLPVVQQMPRRGVPGIVYVISDGRPTAGVRDGRTIINGLTADNQLRQSIFGFGGGKTVNTQMMDLLTYRNKGDAFVEPAIESIDETLAANIIRLKDPLLVDIDANFGSVSTEEVYPRVLPDLYRDKPVVVYGRYDPKNASDFVLRLTGLVGKKQKEVVFHADLKSAQTGTEEIARRWAFEKAYAIIGEIIRKGEAPELRAQLRELRDRFGIRTSYDE